MPDDRDNQALLRHQPEQQVSVFMPYPLNQHLDDLCSALGNTSAGTVRRKELMATLLLHAERDPRELANLVARYREEPAWERTFKRERPGPRTPKP
jgi:hypothetical protein